MLRRTEALASARSAVAAMDIGGDAAHVTVSLGVADYPAHGIDGTRVIKAADTALYRAKQLGRDRVRTPSG